MKKLSILLVVLFGCVGEDIIMDQVEPEVRVTNTISNLEINTTWQFEPIFFDNVGNETTPNEVVWSTSDASVAIINQDGLATGLDYGEVTFTVAATINNIPVSATIDSDVSDDPTSGSLEIRSGKIMTTSSYDLQGNFNISQDGENLLIEFETNYIADQGLPGLYLYLTNNPNSPAGGYEIGAVTVFNGAHSYLIPNVDLFDYEYIFYYCKPFKVKVGHGDIE
ncbi:hypothetical protein [Ekhidna sp.]|uniref:hypothetical protein n=1 Tax=Ekhidna sp. TaxID=2608089 RepID=UPI003297C43B